jgi:TetR/AcrR family fatty acid metabolism transcriptional regulator
MRISDKHGKILQAAIKVFAQKGFYSARISDIANEAKVADGTIYLYFNNKYDILISIFEEEIGKLILEIKNLIKTEEDPRKMLELFARQHMELLRDKKDLAEVLQMELRQSNKFMKEYRNTKFIEYVDIISRIIHKGQEMKVFRSDVMPGVAKRAFFGALDETARLWILSPDNQYTIEEAAGQISNIFLTGITAKG